MISFHYIILINMDEPLISKTVQEEPSGLSTRRDFPSPPSWHHSTAHLITNDAIIPILPTPNSASYANLIANLNKKKLTRRSHSAPSVFTDVREAFTDSLDPRSPLKSTPLIVRQAFIGVALYIIVGIAIFITSGSFKGTATFKPVDALYFSVVTLCTIGYGDIVPDTAFTKLFTCIFILVGFGFIDILLNGLVTYICDRQEAVLLSTLDENRFNSMVQAYMIDRQKGRMRIRMKVCLALGVVILCIAIGTITVHFLEEMSWVDSFYLSVTSVTTVGYGDYAFTTATGRCFAIVWLLVSTLAVARAFLYLTELRIDKRNRMVAKWVLHKKMTLGDLVAADLDNDGSIRYPFYFYTPAYIKRHSTSKMDVSTFYCWIKILVFHCLCICIKDRHANCLHSMNRNTAHS
ncbi:Ion_trans_2 domain-containing protein [Cephalotus follicularis]|uniref:Ion_trans_2 domain-containing protein n=1 Tax=Cephalotus follicularis TaxID=3775 RepID=A0A1Q3DJA0_CEPFO|nr:Ion_trans_2 domain-containing protein [Cephalotus follicularis]